MKFYVYLFTRHLDLEYAYRGRDILLKITAVVYKLKLADNCLQIQKLLLSIQKSKVPFIKCP